MCQQQILGLSARHASMPWKHYRVPMCNYELYPPKITQSSQFLVDSI